MDTTNLCSYSSRDDGRMFVRSPFRKVVPAGATRGVASIA